MTFFSNQVFLLKQYFCLCVDKRLCVVFLTVVYFNDLKSLVSYKISVPYRSAFLSQSDLNLCAVSKTVNWFIKIMQICCTHTNWYNEMNWIFPLYISCITLSFKLYSFHYSSCFRSVFNGCDDRSSRQPFSDGSRWRDERCGCWSYRWDHWTFQWCNEYSCYTLIIALL